MFSKYTQYLLTTASVLSKQRVIQSNSGNGYAYMTCIIVDKKKPYCVLQHRYKLLRD